MTPTVAATTAAASLLLSLILIALTAVSTSPLSFNASIDIFQDVIKAISSRQKWDLQSLRLSELDSRRIRHGAVQRYEFRVRIGKTDLFFKFSDDVVEWKNLGNWEGNFADLARKVGAKSMVRPFKVDGPFELRVDGGHNLSLLLPLNTIHTGLRRVIVGEGIAVEVTGAQEVFLFYEPDIQSSQHRTILNYSKIGFSSYWQRLCTPLLPIRIIGSASLVAYRSRNPTSHISTHSLNKETIELHSEKCYSKTLYRKKQTCPIDSLHTRIYKLESVLRSLLGDGDHQNRPLGFVKANIKGLTFCRFQIQLERNIGKNESQTSEWRTRQNVERVWFEVVARFDGEQLKPLIIKKVKPFEAVNTVAWSSLLSNVSFTKFPPVLLPPESLTLDVKW